MTEARQDAKLLLEKINEAVAAANEAEKIVTTAQAEHRSRSMTVGLLLLEARKLHPAVKDFEAFLKRVQGLHLSRAYDLMRLAGGRTTDEDLRKEARERKQKSRANKKKLPKPTPALKKPEPVSVTNPYVTEMPSSAYCLGEFIIACRTWLPQITVETDRQKVRALVAEYMSSKPKAEAA